MNHNITIQPADTPEAEARFRHQLTLYFRRDIFPGESPETALPPGYWQNIDALHRRAENPLHYLFFRRDGVEIGLTMTVLYLTEDQKQFILEFCVYPAFRGNGTGTACAEALLQWGRKKGAAFFELNAEDPRRVRFWFEARLPTQWAEPVGAAYAAAAGGKNPFYRLGPYRYRRTLGS